MRPDRRWVLAAAGVAVLVAVAVAVAVDDGDGDDAASVVTDATTSTSISSTPSTLVTSTAPPSSLVSTAVPGRVTTTPSTSTTTARCTPPAQGSDFEGFGATPIVIENAQGSRRSCVLTADTPAQQQQGLMRQNDLDGYDGMVFRFPTAEERSFWMRNTSIPLSIAFFDAGGAFVSATDMEPCGDSPDCPGYPSRGAAKFALEVVQGRLPAIGASPGSRLAG